MNHQTNLPRVVPVVDLQGGLVVRGIAGRRDEYRPIRSRLCQNPSPQHVGRALVEQLGLEEAYVADLDAIAGAPPAWKIYVELARCGLALWVDAGIASLERARQLAEFAEWGAPLQRIIVGLETLPAAEMLQPLACAIGSDRLVFSLDLKHGAPLTTIDAWRTLAPLEIAESVVAAGVQRLIVLDLALVGTGQGVATGPLCRAVRQMSPAIEITAGGGVRSVDDLGRLAAAGCDAALVASALHDGRITRDDLQTQTGRRSDEPRRSD